MQVVAVFGHAIVAHLFAMVLPHFASGRSSTPYVSTSHVLNALYVATLVRWFVPMYSLAIARAERPRRLKPFVSSLSALRSASIDAMRTRSGPLITTGSSVIARLLP